jgi:hypothetical protein
LSYGSRVASRANTRVLAVGVVRIRIDVNPQLYTNKNNWLKKQMKKRELKELEKEIEKVRNLLLKKYNEKPDFQDSSVNLISTHLDVMIVQHQRMQLELNKPKTDNPKGTPS